MHLFWSNVVLVLALWLQNSYAIRMQLKPNEPKCLKEEIHKDVLVTGEFAISEADGHLSGIKVTDSKDHLLYQKDKATSGKFSFTTDEYDMFQVCFFSKPHSGVQGRIREAHLDLKHGFDTKDYSKLAQAEKLKPMELELKRLEDLAEAIVGDFHYMREREEKMRDTNESTHSRVLYFSVFSMGCLLALATWQILYLRRYFKSKKLIE